MRPNIKPGPGAHLVDVVLRIRHAAEVAVRHQAELIVVIENHTAVTRNAEIFQQQVAGEDITECQVLDRLAVIDRSCCRLLVAGRLEVQIQRYHAPLDVGVFDDQVVTIDTARDAAFGQ